MYSCPALVGVGSGTLLGPEGSAVQSDLLVGLLFLPLLEAAGGWPTVLVGLLFEICIVDASIFATSSSPAFVGGGGCCEYV